MNAAVRVTSVPDLSRPLPVIQCRRDAHLAKVLGLESALRSQGRPAVMLPDGDAELRTHAWPQEPTQT
jgi:hypothetical protein